MQGLNLTGKMNISQPSDVAGENHFDLVSFDEELRSIKTSSDRIYKGCVTKTNNGVYVYEGHSSNIVCSLREEMRQRGST